MTKNQNKTSAIYGYGMATMPFLAARQEHRRAHRRGVLGYKSLDLEAQLWVTGKIDFIS